MKLIPLLLLSTAALAGDKTPDPTPTPSTATAEARSDADSTSESSAGADASTDVSVRQIGIGGSSAPIPIQPSDCWTTAEGYFKRAHRLAFGLHELSALAEWSEPCAAHQREVLRLQIDLERARADRIRVEILAERELLK